MLVHALDTAGATLLHQAAFEGKPEVGDLLLSKGAHMGAVDCYGMRPMDWAVLNGQATVVELLCAADAHQARSAPPWHGSLTPFQMAAAAGDVDTLRALIVGGATADAGGISAFEIARALGHDKASQLLVESGLAAPSPPRLPTYENAAPLKVRTISASELMRDPQVWDSSLLDSTPLLIEGLADEWADQLHAIPVGALRRKWEHLRVQAASSPTADYQCFANVADTSGRDVLCMLTPPARELNFAEFVDELDANLRDPSRQAGPFGEPVEHIAVQQSSTANLGLVCGLGEDVLPSLASKLVRRSSQDEAESGVTSLPKDLRANLWCCTSPKRSQLHYDGYESLLLQLKGTKRFTLIDPTPICGLAPCPITVPCARLVRKGRGRYEVRPVPAEASERSTFDNFPLLQLQSIEEEKARGRLQALAQHARVVTVDVKAGDALLLPAYWYHEVDSFCDNYELHRESDSAREIPLNIAVNYWWRSHAPIGVRHGILRENLRAKPPC